jgi:hypothetical protein
MPLPKWELATHEVVMCPTCGAASMVRVFPAALASHGGPVRTETAGEGEAACYDHAAKRAVAVCSQCGRFVCQLCSVTVKGEIWCPSCVASGTRKPKTPDLEASRTLYDSMALMLATLPVPFFWFITPLTAPAAMFLAVRYWKRPLGLMRRTRWRFVAAIAIAAIEIGAWIWGTVYLILRLKMRA